MDEYLKKIKDLAIVPPVLISILGLPDDNELSFSKLEKMVESDQVLVARLLKLANSPFYSRGNRVTGIRQILTRLGFRTVRSMVTMALADSIFVNGNYRKFRDEVWGHSIATGVLAAYMAEDYKYKEQHDLALTAGLLLDLGKIILNTIDRKRYIEVLGMYLENDEDIRQIEMKFFGVDSSEVGPQAAKLWQLPDDFVALLEERYKPIPEQSELGRVIRFTDLLVKKIGFGKLLSGDEALLADYANYFGVELTDEYVQKQKERIERDGLYQFCSTL